MKMPETSYFLFLEHQRLVLHQIYHQIRIPRPSFNLKPIKTVFYSIKMQKTGDVLFLEHQISVLDKIWHQIRIPHPSFTLKPVFYYTSPPYKRTGDKKRRLSNFVFFVPVQWNFPKNCLKNTKIYQKVSPVQLSPVQFSSKIGRLSSLSPVVLYGGGCTWKCRKTAMFYLPPFTPRVSKPGFYDACCTKNRGCSIFRTSGVGANLNSYSYSPSPI